ncbi:Thioredoxin domain-containing protein 17 [Trachymyrmex septentrionalis]|uniref:Thioredoxin domain-containing protein 17 n=1 Tax=Trachymyrmex septentrionalis TaxID=34720 RepID=A0A195FUA8_9HYME|nr:PREDICTED: thioredoxin domain-containing protein 17-like [Trachymyrmex septentrionalis]KYN43469.1 Thioredoxin domain-containing protein 17 [Trachymyrmex septentrionalis]
MVPSIERRYVQGYEKFLEVTNLERSEQPNYVLFTGTKLLDTGKSWCSDCVEAEPFIEAGFADAPQGTILLTVEVGDRAFWKDPNCPFRTDRCTRLKVLPTLVKWRTEKRLEGDQLLNPDLIEMLLSDVDAD